MSNRYHTVVVPAFEACQTRQEAPVESMSFWINGVLTLGLVVLGLTGNLIIMASLGCNTKRWLPLYYYFMAFSIWNTTLLLATIIFYCLSALHPNNMRYYENPLFAYLNIVGYPFANSGMTASVWLVLCLTVERALVVSRPLDRFVTETKRRAKLVTLAISILAPLYSLPLFFELRVQEVDEEFIRADNSTIAPLFDIVKTGLRSNIAYKVIYRIVCNLLFLSLVPFVIVITLSARIVCVIRKRVEEGDRCPPSCPDASPGLKPISLNHYSAIAMNDANANRRGASSRGRCHLRSTCDTYQRTHVTLTILAAKYVICYTLPTLLNILELMLEPKSLREMGVGLLIDLSDLMVVADGALNAFVYFSWRRNIQLRGLSFRSKAKAAQRHLLPKPSTYTTSSDENKRVTFL